LNKKKKSKCKFARNPGPIYMLRCQPVDLLCRCLVRELLREGFLDPLTDAAPAS